MELTKNEYRSARMFAQESLSKSFPFEKLGIADKALLNSIGIRCAKEFKEGNGGRLICHHNLVVLFYEEAKRYGFIPREMEEFN